MPNKSQGEDELARQLSALGIDFETQYRWTPNRRFKADFYLGQHWLCEVEGGAWSGGHRRGAEANKDCERHNDAMMMGFRTLRFTPYMVETGEAIAVIEAALELSARA
jgi:very-short-patch-repair endonuclease